MYTFKKNYRSCGGKHYESWITVFKLWAKISTIKGQIRAASVATVFRVTATLFSQVIQAKEEAH